MTYIEAKSKKIFVSELHKSQKMMTMITSKNPSSLPELKELRLNTMCLAFFDECWYVMENLVLFFLFPSVQFENLSSLSDLYFCVRFRARIVSVDPLKVYYIDFGNTESAQKNDLRMSPDEFAHICPLVCIAFYHPNRCHCSFFSLIELS